MHMFKSILRCKSTVKGSAASYYHHRYLLAVRLPSPLPAGCEAICCQHRYRLAVRLPTPLPGCEAICCQHRYLAIIVFLLLLDAVFISVFVAVFIFVYMFVELSSVASQLHMFCMLLRLHNPHSQ